MKFLFQIFLFLLPGCVLAQLYIAHDNGKYGYINGNGELLIPFNFDKVEEFVGKKASVKMHDKWGLIDTSGNFIIEPNYHKVTSLGGDLVGLKKDDKFGIINIRTREEIPPTFSRVEYFDNELFKGYKSNLCGLYNIKGENLLPNRYLRLDKKSVKGYIVAINSLEKVVYNQQLDSLKSFELKDQLSFFSSFVVHKQKDRWRMIYDCQGRFTDSIPKAVAEPISKNFLLFTHYSDSQSVCVYSKDTSFCFPLDKYEKLSDKYYSFSNHTGFYALFDSTGSQLSSFKYQSIRYNPISKVFFFKSDQGTQISSLENRVFGNEYYEDYRFLSSKIVLVMSNNLWGVINLNGKVYAKCRYHSFAGDSLNLKGYSSGGVALLNFNKKGILEEKRRFNNFSQIKVLGQNISPLTPPWGRLSVIPPKCLNSNDFGWYQTRKGKKNYFGLIDELSGDTIIKSRYTSVCVFDSSGNTLIGFEKKKKDGLLILNITKPRYSVYGIVNGQGKRVLPMRYVSIDQQSLRDTTSEIIRVIAEKSSGSVSLINLNDKSYKNIFRFVDKNYFGLSRASRKGKIEKAFGVENVLGHHYYMLNTFNVENDFSWHYKEKRTGYVVKDGLWGFINKKGEEVIPFEYDYVTNFNQGVSFVQKEGKWGAIDTTGKLIVPIKFAFIEFSKWNKKIIKVYNESQNWGILDSKGNKKVSPKYKIIKGYYDGRMLVGQTKRKMFYINDSGKRLYSDIGVTNAFQFIDGKSPAYINRKWGVIDTTGNIIIEPKFKEIRLYNDRYFVAKESWQAVLYDYSGKPVLKRKVKNIYALGDSYFRGSKKRNNGLYNYTGKTFIKSKFTEIDGKDGGYLVKKNDKYGWLNLEGKKVLPTKFQKVFPLNENRLLAIKNRTVFGFNSDGKNIFKNDSFIDCEQFSSGLAPVKTKLGWGAIDSVGKLVVQDKYRRFRSFIDSTAVVATKGETSLVYVDGNTLHNKTYRFLGEYSEGYYSVGLNGGGCNYLNTQGGLINNVHYGWVRPFRDGCGVVFIGNKAGAIDKHGNEIIPCRYQDLRVIPGYGFSYKQNETFGFYNLNGRQLTPLDLNSQKIANGKIQIIRGNEIGYLNLDGTVVWRIQ